MGHRYYVFSHPVEHSDKVQKYITQHELETATCDGVMWASNCPGAVQALQDGKHKGDVYDKVLQCLTNELVTVGRWQRYFVAFPEVVQIYLTFPGLFQLLLFKDALQFC